MAGESELNLMPAQSSPPDTAMDKARKPALQQVMIDHLLSHGWQEGKAELYDPALALYPEDLIGFVQECHPQLLLEPTQGAPDQAIQLLLRRAAAEMDLRGALEVLRHGFREQENDISLCQFHPYQEFHPGTLARYKKNRLRVVPNLSYSPYTHEDYIPYLDLVFFVNGVPVATLKATSESQPSLSAIIHQYQRDYLPQEPRMGHEEPLLAFKKRALVHFAVSPEEVWITTRLQGKATHFMPFNQGYENGAGNPLNPAGYPTDYLWQKIFERDTWLDLLGQFIHFEGKNTARKEEKGLSSETLIFPRFHQWEMVTQLAEAVRREGPGQRYLIQHGAGSGQPHSIAWTAHRLAALADGKYQKIFTGVIVVTGCHQFHAQLQDMLYSPTYEKKQIHQLTQEIAQNCQAEGLAATLAAAGTHIITVTPQDFPSVLALIQNQALFKEYTFAVIAHQAPFSTSRSLFSRLGEVLLSESAQKKITTNTEDFLNISLANSPPSPHISYFLFTAVPQEKTLALFGQYANPTLPLSDNNGPGPFHRYTLQQAIEEGFLFDPLKRYMTYAMAAGLAQQQLSLNKEENHPSCRIFPWMGWPPDDLNIAQKAEIITEHFRHQVAHLLNGQAKAILITHSCQAAERYQQAFARYIAAQQYQSIQTLINHQQVIIGAHKHQANVSSSRLCALYVDKKFTDTDCVQTLSHLSEIHPGKKAPFVLDFANPAEQILNAFRPYYPDAEIFSISDPRLIYQLQSHLDETRIYNWQDVESFAATFFGTEQTTERLNYHCQSAVERFREQYQENIKIIQTAQQAKQEATATGDRIRRENVCHSFEQAEENKNALDQFRENLLIFTDCYEYLSQILDYNDQELEKLNIYARYLYSLLGEMQRNEAIDSSSQALISYRINKICERTFKTAQQESLGEPKHNATGDSRENHWKKTIPPSPLINRLKPLLVGEHLSDGDRLNYLHAIKDKLLENPALAAQLEDQRLNSIPLSDFSQTVQHTVMESLKNHHEMAAQLLHDEEMAKDFSRLLLALVSNQPEQ
ncbi:type I restriction endonuclease subunit R [Nitrosococcus watsonii]|uniref:Type I site-specific restriction-modification system, R subunit (Helicase) n=1 Tax=Nitrosococcus watsoni (strain C-113) TaxID=105559 RepID=D8K8R7_NITWC|nr:type I restriction endonuclease subunit R [Nitrosococcus watsonii]ADJ27127.1 type I site-specific restriction-modification system, R subunit (helicase) [Nitrosococcus watsonii C-113]